MTNRLKLYIDIETYSSVNIKESGLFKYMESPDFEILLIGYTLGDTPYKVIDLASHEEMPEDFVEALLDPNVEKIAHNAMFERVAFNRVGLSVPVEQWTCTMIKAAYMGLPFSLAQVSKALDLETKKLDTGTKLINYFCVPCKPTITNKGRTRNFPEHDKVGWEAFKEYLKADVGACKEIDERLANYTIPEIDIQLYNLDQKINDFGIHADLAFVKNAIQIEEVNTAKLKTEMYTLTGLANPNSAAQLAKWLSSRLGKNVTSVAADAVKQLLTEVEDVTVRRVLTLRQALGKTSTAKYKAIINSAVDGRIRGLFQYYGANATGRWAGRLVQLHNLPQNHIADLDFARDCVLQNDIDTLEFSYKSVAGVLSQLIRTAFVPTKGNLFLVGDFSAIESRVVSWLAGEEWRLEVFRTHGKIYEATASKMFNVPLRDIDKGSPYRQLGKIAELALGFGGSVGALDKMDRNKEIPDEDKPGLVRTWRRANPKIVTLWREVNERAISCVSTGQTIVLDLAHTKLIFKYNGEVFTIVLPNGHELHYWRPKIKENKFGSPGLTYMSLKSGMWVREDTYGGKLIENIVQATARDLLGHNMLKLDKLGFDIVMHVHDENVVQTCECSAEDDLKLMLKLMGQDVPWAPGLPMAAAGFVTNYYKKD